ncbi:MAG: CcmD family protein [Bacteroidota bacterium]
MNKNLAIVLLSLIGFCANAQEGPQMADAFRENGKIYVVISVIAIIFLALVVFLVYLERKLNKLEKQFKNKAN